MTLQDALDQDFYTKYNASYVMAIRVWIWMRQIADYIKNRAPASNRSTGIHVRTGR